ncbi:MAG: nucleoside deaminase [Bdellovibrionaceae bacterium]|nr:nucleoside deaminase [Pseudobdellovibrionaceae bacterium]
MSKDEFYMKMALDEAHKAAKQGEVPVGAIVVDSSGNIIGMGFNRKESGADPTLHAEIIALKEAAKSLKNWRLRGCTLYVTLEPCPMCAGALVQARVDRVAFGTLDLKGGGICSKYTIGNDPRLNHQFIVSSGILEKECSLILTKFFKDLRQSKT